MGVDIVEGIPHFERTMQQGADSVIAVRTCRGTGLDGGYAL